MPGKCDFRRASQVRALRSKGNDDFIPGIGEPTIFKIYSDVSDFFERRSEQQDFDQASSKNDGGSTHLTETDATPEGEEGGSPKSGRVVRRKVISSYREKASSVEKQAERVLKGILKLSEGETFPVNYKDDIIELAQKCLRLPRKTKIPKKLKVYPEAPITVRLGWFMEKQLENMKLLNPPYSWETIDVVNWICDTLHLPQYKGMFEVNQIKGRHLPLIDAEKLEKMGMSDFNHIIMISQEIRKLLKIGKEVYVWNKVAEARYDPQTLHNMYNYRYPKKKLPVSEFYKEHHIVHKREPNCSLFEILPSTWDIFPRNIHRVTKKSYFLNNFDSYPKDRKTYEVEKFW